jgi:Tol biopolymer transport system component
MRKTAILLVSMALALLLASVVAVVVPKERARAAFPGKNAKIAFQSDRAGNFEIYTISPTGGDLKRLTNYPESDKAAAWSPNGKKIVFQKGDSLYTMNADGSNERKIPHTTHFNYEIGRYGTYGGNPAFSPSGSKIIFEMDKNLYSINVDGTNRTRITNAHAGGASEDDPTFAYAAWSPVDNRIAFTWMYDGAREIHVMPLSDMSDEQYLGPESRITPAGVGVYRPDWSPDGTKLTYECSEDPCEASASNPSYNPEIYKVSADGSDNTRLTNDPANESYPAFSPGGGKIVFSSNRDGDYDLYIVNADGTNVRQLTNNPHRDLLADWQPVR